MERVYLLLGTNQGDKERNLKTAIALLITELAPFLGSDVKESSIHESEPVGFDSNENFLNQAISFKTSVSPTDLLLFGNRSVDLPELKIPHPRLQEREFALIPLREIYSEQN